MSTPSEVFIDDASYSKLLEICQWTPVHMAAREGYDSTVKFLADNGADINMGDCEEVCEATLPTILHLDNSFCVSIDSTPTIPLLLQTQLYI